MGLCHQQKQMFLTVEIERGHGQLAIASPEVSDLTATTLARLSKSRSTEPVKLTDSAMVLSCISRDDSTHK